MIDGIRNLIVRCAVETPGLRPVLLWLSRRLSSGTEVFEPQGVHFRAPADAQGLLLSPNGDPSNAVAVGLSGEYPDETGENALQPGEGGLHYLGTWRIYIDRFEAVHLGERNAADWVALKSLVEAELQKLSDRVAVFERTFAAWTPVAMDGGAALKTAYEADPGTPGAAPGNVGSTKVKCK